MLMFKDFSGVNIVWCANSGSKFSAAVAALAENLRW
jgi:hypothetical protein